MKSRLLSLFSAICLVAAIGILPACSGDDAADSTDTGDTSTDNGEETG